MPFPRSTTCVSSVRIEPLVKSFNEDKRLSFECVDAQKELGGMLLVSRADSVKFVSFQHALHHSDHSFGGTKIYVSKPSPESTRTQMHCRGATRQIAQHYDYIYIITCSYKPFGQDQGDNDARGALDPVIIHQHYRMF